MVESSNDTLPKPPMITVWITTFNHGEFIAQAIESVLMQHTTYNYEIVIGEDCSADNTRQIVMAYQEKYPDIINAYLPEANLGMMRMFLDSYELCSGKYIAWLDGDDYWTHKDKLQKQVDFMEANPDYMLTFHAINYQETDTDKVYPSQHPDQKEPDDTYVLEDFFKYNLAPSVSVIHRNVLAHPLPHWLKDLPFPDLAMHILLLLKGKAKYFRDVMAVYRIHNKGAWSGIPEYDKTAKLALFYRKIIARLKLEKNGKIRNIIFPLFKTTLQKSIEYDRWKDAVFNFWYLLYSFSDFPKNDRGLFKKSLRYFAGLIPRKLLGHIKKTDNGKKA